MQKIALNLNFYTNNYNYKKTLKNPEIQTKPPAGYSRAKRTNPITKPDRRYPGAKA